MFGQILFTQWRWTRVMVATMAIGAFVTPAVAWWLGGQRVLDPARPAAVIYGFGMVAPMLVLISLLGSFLLAVYPWTMDAAARHVLPLSLPIRWRQYVAMRFGAGALLLVVPAIALWLGSLLLLSMMDLPTTLRAYPGAIALRFLAASMLVYAMVFALQYLAGRRSAMVALVLVLAFGLASFTLQWTGNAEFGARVMRVLTDFPGPFAVYTTEWKLIDV